MSFVESILGSPGEYALKKVVPLGEERGRLEPSRPDIQDAFPHGVMLGLLRALRDTWRKSQSPFMTGPQGGSQPLREELMEVGWGGGPQKSIHEGSVLMTPSQE